MPDKDYVGAKLGDHLMEMGNCLPLSLTPPDKELLSC
jgi:hypothetical protein